MTVSRRQCHPVFALCSCISPSRTLQEFGPMSELTRPGWITRPHFPGPCTCQVWMATDYISLTHMTYVDCTAPDKVRFKRRQSLMLPLRDPPRRCQKDENRWPCYRSHVLQPSSYYPHMVLRHSMVPCPPVSKRVCEHDTSTPATKRK